MCIADMALALDTIDLPSPYLLLSAGDNTPRLLQDTRHQMAAHCDELWYWKVQLDSNLS